MRRFHGSYFLALTLLLFLGYASISLGQEKTISVGAGILPAPLYPVDGNVDQRFPNQFVFFDPRTMDIVLAYRTAPGAPRTVHRIKRPPRIAPEVVSTVARTPKGGFRYRYRVTNGPKSGQPIGAWLLSIPKPKPVDLTKPAPQASHDAGQRRPWRQSVYSFRPGEWSVRFAGRAGALLESSQSAAFVVDNQNRPGVVKAYFHGAVSSVDSLPEDLPPEARKQLERVKRLQGWDNTVRWTIGPKYNETASSLEIAVDFHSSVSTLARQPGLPSGSPVVQAMSGLPIHRHRNLVPMPSGSPFVQTVLARLDEFIQRPRPWDDVQDYSPPVDEPFRPIGQPPDPRSSFEQQLDLALKLSLVRP